MILTVDDLSSLSIENLNHPFDLHLILPGATLSIPHTEELTILNNDYRIHLKSRGELDKDECKKIHGLFIQIFCQWKMDIYYGKSIEYEQINDWITIY